jgi:hypothetical protein
MRVTTFSVASKKLHQSTNSGKQRELEEKSIKEIEEESIKKRKGRRLEK